MRLGLHSVVASGSAITYTLLAIAIIFGFAAVESEAAPLGLRGGPVGERHVGSHQQEGMRGLVRHLYESAPGYLEKRADTGLSLYERPYASESPAVTPASLDSLPTQVTAQMVPEVGSNADTNRSWRKSVLSRLASLWRNTAKGGIKGGQLFKNFWNWVVGTVTRVYMAPGREEWREQEIEKLGVRAKEIEERIQAAKTSDMQALAEVSDSQAHQVEEEIISTQGNQLAAAGQGTVQSAEHPTVKEPGAEGRTRVLSKSQAITNNLADTNAVVSSYHPYMRKSGTNSDSALPGTPNSIERQSRGAADLASAKKIFEDYKERQKYGGKRMPPSKISGKLDSLPVYPPKARTPSIPFSQQEESVVSNEANSDGVQEGQAQAVGLVINGPKQMEDGKPVDSTESATDNNEGAPATNTAPDDLPDYDSEDDRLPPDDSDLPELLKFSERDIWLAGGQGLLVPDADTLEGDYFASAEVHFFARKELQDRVIENLDRKDVRDERAEKRKAAAERAARRAAKAADAAVAATIRPTPTPTPTSSFVLSHWDPKKKIDVSQGVHGKPYLKYYTEELRGEPHDTPLSDDWEIEDMFMPEEEFYRRRKAISQRLNQQIDERDENNQKPQKIPSAKPAVVASKVIGTAEIQPASQSIVPAEALVLAVNGIEVPVGSSGEAMAPTTEDGSAVSYSVFKQPVSEVPEFAVHTLPTVFDSTVLGGLAVSDPVVSTTPEISEIAVPILPTVFDSTVLGGLVVPDPVVSTTPEISEIAVPILPTVFDSTVLGGPAVSDPVVSTTAVPATTVEVPEIAVVSTTAVPVTTVEVPEIAVSILPTVFDSIVLGRLTDPNSVISTTVPVIPTHFSGSAVGVEAPKPSSVGPVAQLRETLKKLSGIYSRRASRKAKEDTTTPVSRPGIVQNVQNVRTQQDNAMVPTARRRNPKGFNLSSILQWLKREPDVDNTEDPEAHLEEVQGNPWVGESSLVEQEGDEDVRSIRWSDLLAETDGWQDDTKPENHLGFSDHFMRSDGEGESWGESTMDALNKIGITY